MKNTLFKIVILSFVLISIRAPLVEAVTGSIDSTSHYAQVCHDVTCTTPTPGVLNFKPTTGTAVVVDTVTGLSGNIWGNELGWIDLHPTGEGVVFADVATGRLTGKAWSQVSGWINFAPTGQQVVIDPDTGEFSGWAWTGGPQGGWIKFDCGDADTCVKVASWGGGSGGGSSYGQQKDVCPNINGWQGSIPIGYSVDGNGYCVFVMDHCPNIAGVQSGVPVGYTLSADGFCRQSDIDHCPNIEGIQTSIPSGYLINQSGDCIKQTLDYCPNMPGTQYSTSECSDADACKNLPGIQSSTPYGYTSTGDDCYLLVLDLCPNIPGNQTSIPLDTVLSSDGNCNTQPEDICSNLSGDQSTVPQGFYHKGGLCLFGVEESEPGESSGVEKIIAFKFVPSWLHIPSYNKLLKSLISNFVPEARESYPIDITSVTIGVFGILVFLYLLRRLFRTL